MPFFRISTHGESGFTLLDPASKPFLSIGLNHIEESSLLYPHNKAIHSARYPTRHSFLQTATSRIQAFGFNTIGWTPEYVAGDTDDNLHSSGWTDVELLHCGMPYMVALPIMDIQNWNAHPTYRDPEGRHFKEWCEFLARSVCMVHKDSELCIGYFFVDIPGWARHRSGEDFPQLKGLSSQERERSIYRVAQSYYSVICGAIKEVDPNHLIFGDRLDGNADIPDGVLRAMKEYVDVLSVQYFCDPPGVEGRSAMVENLRRWQRICEKPVLIADIGNHCPTALNPLRKSAIDSQKDRGEDYRSCISLLSKENWFIGWHWCGYLESSSGRGWGIVDPFDQPYADLTSTIKVANEAAKEEKIAMGNVDQKQYLN